MTRKAIMPFLLALLAVIVLLQYELREYLRYYAKGLWYLSWMFYHSVAGFCALGVLIWAALKWWRGQGRTTALPLATLVVGALLIVWVKSWTRTIEYDDIVLSGEHFVDRRTGEPLEGTYRSPSAWDGFGEGPHCAKVQFEDGRHTGRWMYSFKGDLIHHGSYLALPKEFTDPVETWCGCARVEATICYEGRAPMLGIDLIAPTGWDTTDAGAIERLAFGLLHGSYPYTTIFIAEQTQAGRHHLHRAEVNESTGP
jgi:hypothetical protein